MENSTHRPIPVEDCRGFVLVDEYAPFMFIHNADFKSAQLFTIGHELVDIWIGKSAGFDFKQMLPAKDPIERLCDHFDGQRPFFLVSAPNKNINIMGSFYHLTSSLYCKIE